ncbi:hypothetical protein AHF37_11994 [Paragonimus kellicotti]|nr:hypothetical protein AHF37_11994 [Paragonimus kellicotti]
MALDPKYTDFGLDWFSSLRYVEPYCDEQRKDEKLWPEHCSRMRTFSGSFNHGMSPEWLLYTNGFRTGKRCHFAGNHRRSQHCAEEFDLSCDEIMKRHGSFNHGMSPEWLLYTNGFRTGKRCHFAGNHRRSQHCAEEFDLSCDEIMKRHVSTIVQHNGIHNPFRPGDKPYRVVEYSPDFYKIESAVPKTQFG